MAELATLIPIGATAFAALFGVYITVKVRRSAVPPHVTVLVAIAALGVTALGVMDVLDAPRLVFSFSLFTETAILAATVVAAIRVPRAQDER